MFDFDQLEAFVSVATLGGFTRASEQLHRTQPAVSRRIQQLERNLGRPLFERHKREVRLTEVGELFLPYAESTLATLREGIHAVKHQQEQAPLRIALVGTLADLHLSKALKGFQQRNPLRDIQLRTATSREVSTLVSSGEADIGIRYFEDFRSGLESISIGEDKLLLVCPYNHPLAGKTLKTSKQLADEQWLTFPTDTKQPDSFGHLLVRALLDIGISEPRLTFIDSLTAQKRLVQAGFGLALIPPGSCEDELANGSLAQIRLKGLNVSQPVHAVYKTKPLKALAIEEFLAGLRSAMKT